MTLDLPRVRASGVRTPRSPTPDHLLPSQLDHRGIVRRSGESPPPDQQRRDGQDQRADDAQNERQDDPGGSRDVSTRCQIGPVQRGLPCGVGVDPGWARRVVDDADAVVLELAVALEVPLPSRARMPALRATTAGRRRFEAQPAEGLEVQLQPGVRVAREHRPLALVQPARREATIPCRDPRTGGRASPWCRRELLTEACLVARKCTMGWGRPLGPRPRLREPGRGYR